MYHHKKVATVVVLDNEETQAARKALRHVLLKLQEEIEAAPIIDKSNWELYSHRSILNSLIIPMVDD